MLSTLAPPRAYNNSRRQNRLASRSAGWHSPIWTGSEYPRSAPFLTQAAWRTARTRHHQDRFGEEFKFYISAPPRFEYAPPGASGRRGWPSVLESTCADVQTAGGGRYVHFVGAASKKTGRRPFADQQSSAGPGGEASRILTNHV